MGAVSHPCFDWSVEDLKMLSGRCGVYILRNVVTEWSYVGASTNLRSRIVNHWNWMAKGYRDNDLCRAYRRHGEQVFRFEILEIEPPDLDAAERRWLRIIRPEYNHRIDGDYFELTAEQRAKIVASNRRRAGNV